MPRPPDRREIGASSFENMISTESFAEGRYHSGAKRTRTWMWQGGRPCRAMLWTASRTNWRTGPTWRESRMNRGAHASGSQVKTMSTSPKRSIPSNTSAARVSSSTSPSVTITSWSSASSTSPRRRSACVSCTRATGTRSWIASRSATASAAQSSRSRQEPCWVIASPRCVEWGKFCLQKRCKCRLQYRASYFR